MIGSEVNKREVDATERKRSEHDVGWRFELVNSVLPHTTHLMSLWVYRWSFKMLIEIFHDSRELSLFLTELTPAIRSLKKLKLMLRAGFYSWIKIEVDWSWSQFNSKEFNAAEFTHEYETTRLIIKTTWEIKLQILMFPCTTMIEM